MFRGRLRARVSAILEDALRACCCGVSRVAGGTVVGAGGTCNAAGEHTVRETGCKAPSRSACNKGHAPAALGDSSGPASGLASASGVGEGAGAA